MKFNNADIRSIIKAQENDTLTIFVGAGFSKFAETETIKFPDWNELMGSFVKDLNLDENDADKHNYLKLAQLYFLEFGEYRLYERLKEVIPLHASPDQLHKALFELQPKYILTTNWDNLLEKTITEQGLLYDVIKSDADFVKSTLPKKLIKIHGDLDAHNIVFKEDDYLNYSLNMPLIDNFLRHILSSTTVLFLGYSYSDNNLKQIVKWIEKESQVSPPRFLLNLKGKASQLKYYENHHIRVISPNKDIDRYKDLYEGFFKSINKYDDILILSAKTKSDIVDYFFNKLQDLAELNALLPEQLTALFSNCTVEYHNACFVLWFHQPKGVLTSDYDEGIRNLYSKFFKIFNEVSADLEHPLRKKMDFIITCFTLAGVVFLKHNENEYIDIFSKYYTEDKDLSKEFICKNEVYYYFITFSKKMPKNLLRTITFFDNKKLDFLEELNCLISKNKREKMYFTTLINQFNYQFVAKNIVSDYKINEHEKIKAREVLNKIDKKFSLSDYPKRYEKSLKVLLDFLEFKFVYILYYKSKIDNSKNIENAKNIKNGGFGIYHKEKRSEDNCIQVLKFISANEINMDVYTEFKDLMQSYVTSKIESQSIHGKISLAEHDLFILIKYFKFNDLLSIIYKKILSLSKELGKNKKEADKNKEIDFMLFSDLSPQYLRDTLDNLLELFVIYSDSFYSNVISNSFINLLLILSLVNWQENELEEIIDKILQSLSGNNYPYDLIKAIDKFVLINYSLYQPKTNQYFRFIDVMLTKFIQGELNRLVLNNINNEFSHIYQFGQVESTKYDNLELVNKVIKYIIYISEDDVDIKRHWVELFLMRLAPITDEKTKKVIQDFVEDIRIEDWNNELNNKYREIFTELDFLQYGADLNKEFIDFLDNWIENHLDEDVMTSIELLKEGGVDLMIEYFIYLSKYKKIKQFKNLKNKLDDKLKELYSNNDKKNKDK